MNIVKDFEQFNDLKKLVYTRYYVMANFNLNKKLYLTRYDNVSSWRGGYFRSSVLYETVYLYENL